MSPIRIPASSIVIMFLLYQPIAHASMVTGHAFLEGQTDHSGISVELAPHQALPAMGTYTAALLLIGFGCCLLRMKSRVSGGSLCLLAVCMLARAALMYTGSTDLNGYYWFNDVTPGTYDLLAASPGYHTGMRIGIEIGDGEYELEDITLDQVTTPTPIPDCTGGGLIATDGIIGELRCVPQGSWLQGSPPDEPCRGPDESQFTHALSHALGVMETEITRQMWADLKSLQPSLPDDPSVLFLSPTMQHPVQNNSWYEAILFANLLSDQNGLNPCYFKDASFSIPVDASNFESDPIFCDFSAAGYRLPTEGEWEYAARAGTSGPFSCDEPLYFTQDCLYTLCQPGILPTLEQHCIFCANQPGITETVASRLPNPWGLYDMHGNLWESCWDWYGAYPASHRIDYRGPDSGTKRIWRGGGWSDRAYSCRSSVRYSDTPDYRCNILGFRLVRTLP